MKKGDYKNAIEGFKQEIKINPENPRAYANLGFSYMHDNPPNKKSALLCFERAFLLGGDFDAYRFDYAALLTDENKLQEAKEQYEKYIEKFPDNEYAYYNMGLLFQKNKDLENAILNFKKTLAINPQNKDAKIQLALTHQLNGNYSLANNIYDEVVSIQSENAELLYDAALSYVLRF